MANRRNSIKKIRADELKRTRNKDVKSELRTITRSLLAACAEKKHDEAQAVSKTLFSKMDKALKKNILKENTVNRKKSRLTKHMNLAKTA